MPKELSEVAVKPSLTEGIDFPLTEADFHALPLPLKHATLRELPASQRMALILSDQERKRLVRDMQPQELYWLMKEIGVSDAVVLLRHAAPEQVIFMLDMELWSGWTFSEEKGVEFFGYLLELGDDEFLETLPLMDYHLLALFLGREILVGGGIGDLDTDEERLADWDHSFDSVFMIKFRKPRNARIVGALLERISRLDYELYVALMESVKADVDAELEEECYRFRTGRLEDLGFPPLETAKEIYARVDPSSFDLTGSKKLLPGVEGIMVPVLDLGGQSLLKKAFARAETPELLLELNYLINSALVADDAPFADIDTMHDVMQRVYGFLNLALEYLCGEDEEKGADVLGGEPLKRLFQLGFSIVLGLRGLAQQVSGAGYETGRILAGLKEKVPRFYRGLDPDVVDGYRNFTGIEDVRRITEVLNSLKG